MQNGTAALQNSIVTPKKLKIELPYHSLIPFLVIICKELRSGIQRDTSISMLIEVLFTIGKRWDYTYHKELGISYNI